jgi:SepF-like predicted cell division protein (DUF552 family)
MQHKGKDLSAWMDDIGLEYTVRQAICDLVSNLTDLKDEVEEEDIIEIKLTRISERKLRKVLKKLGNQNVQIKGPRDSISRRASEGEAKTQAQPISRLA